MVSKSKEVLSWEHCVDGCDLVTRGGGESGTVLDLFVRTVLDSSARTMHMAEEFPHTLLREASKTEVC